MFYSVILFLASTKVNAIEMLGKKCINEEKKKKGNSKIQSGDFNSLESNTYQTRRIKSVCKPL